MSADHAVVEFARPSEKPKSPRRALTLAACGGVLTLAGVVLVLRGDVSAEPYREAYATVFEGRRQRDYSNMPFAFQAKRYYRKPRRAAAVTDPFAAPWPAAPAL